MSETCIQCGKPVKDEPGQTKVIYLVRLEKGGDGFLCSEVCWNKEFTESSCDTHQEAVR